MYSGEYLNPITHLCIRKSIHWKINMTRRNNVVTRLSDKELEWLDNFAEELEVSRSEALRQCIYNTKINFDDELREALKGDPRIKLIESLIK